ncbi:MAG: prepilin peptidase [Thiotrichaceae bacterium]|nr:prepilin peptidase [Thiotrichaceae bacterium]PCI14773.1 MAG: prepilin peptidase [Thiotrichales bacterium]
MLLLFNESPAVFISAIGILGLLIGSFLNVVILRLPIMMEKEWFSQCNELLEVAPTDKQADKPFNLVTPNSHCPKCNHEIRAIENIPILSYLFLKGSCSDCGAKIPARYPIIEATTALLSIAVAWHFGPSWEAAAALLLTWALITLTVIDFDHQLLPDSITLPFLWLGLGLSLAGVFTDPAAAIIGGLVGYLSLWSVYILFKLTTGKEGMGHGDFKLLAMLGAWLGWQAVLPIILISSIVGAIVGITLIVVRGRDKNIPIPFGPYLATAGWITLLWGDQIIQTYLTTMGISA